MILLGIILLIIGIFVARHILFPIAAVLIGVGALIWIIDAAGHPICTAGNGCY